MKKRLLVWLCPRLVRRLVSLILWIERLEDPRVECVRIQVLVAAPPGDVIARAHNALRRPQEPVARC